MISLICGILEKQIMDKIKQKQTYRYIEQTGGSQRALGVWVKQVNKIKRYKPSHK